MQENSSSLAQLSNYRLPTSPWLLPVLVFVCVAIARIVYVSLYSAALPFWDQWDELDLQILPLFNGTYHFTQLFAPHLEHRIAFTRVISFILAIINGHVFDNMVEAYTNAFIYALLWGVLYAFLIRHNTNKTQRWLIALTVVALGILPFDWENTLIGYQNAFYFLELGAVVLVGVAVYRTCSVSTIILLTVLAIANLFTMASGLLAAPAAAFAILLCTWRKPKLDVRLLTVLTTLVLVAIFGLILMEHAPAENSLRTTSLFSFVKGLFAAMAWPLQSSRFNAPRWAFAAIIWAPTIVWLCVFCKTRRAETNEIFAVSVAGWVFLQCLAIAYSRGHNMQDLPSRYSEILAIGLASNMWLALKLAGRGHAARWVSPAIAIAVLLVGWIFWYRTPGDFAAMRQRHIFTTIETHNVQRYLSGMPLPALPVNSLDIPYPTATRLRALLDDAAIRKLLPPSVFPATKIPRRWTPLSNAAAAAQATIRGWFPKHAWVIGSRELEALTPTKFHLYTHTVTSNPRNRQCSLDAINGQPSANAKPVSPSSAVIFGGWMGNGHGKPVVDGTFILKNTTRSYAAPFTTGVRRPDVAKAWHSEAMARSGYNLTATLSGVVAGTYSLFATDPTDPSALCDLHRTLTVQ